jgi:hypothetical protein
MLQKQHMGMRRTTLLAKIRKIKDKKPKADRKKYIPKKYRKKAKEKPVSMIPRQTKVRKPVFFGKHVAVFGYAKIRGIFRSYSARFEFYGNGKDLARAVRLAYNGIVPRFTNPFVECSARDFLNDPFKYGERGFWSRKPDVES